MTMTLTLAANKALRLPSEGSGDFLTQMKALTEQDKQDLCDHFNNANPPIEGIELPVVLKKA